MREEAADADRQETFASNHSENEGCGHTSESVDFLPYLMSTCNCPNDGMSDFDRGIQDAFIEGTLAEMPDSVTINGFLLPCSVSERSLAQVNIKGGKSIEIRATLDMLKTDFARAGGNRYGGDSITFQDGEVGKISAVDDADGPVYTIHVGPRLEGAAGPGGGRGW